MFFGKKITSCNVVVMVFGSRSFRLSSLISHTFRRRSSKVFPPKLISTFVSDGLGERTNCSMPPAHVANLSSAGIAVSNHFSLLKIVTRLILVNKWYWEVICNNNYYYNDNNNLYRQGYLQSNGGPPSMCKCSRSEKGCRRSTKCLFINASFM